MLSPSATRFVGPLTFAALSRHPVETELLDLLPDGRIGHIVVADSADAIVVAPATAHWLGAMANGLAGDVVTATCLATSAPVVVAPAMDGDMWTHPATAGNVARLRDDFGYRIVEPASGPLASGQSGVGRLAETAAIVDAVAAAVDGRPVRAADPAARPPLTSVAHEADLAGRHVVVTAGGTREPIDPVRFIGNRSTGKMGLAVVRAALDRGARVTLLAANIEVALPDDPELTVVRTGSTAELETALRRVTADDGAVGGLRCARDGRRRRGLPAVRRGRSEAAARRRADARARSRPRTCSRRSPRPPGPSSPGPSSSASRPRPARSSGPRTSSAARAWTSSSRTTWRSRAPGSAPTPTGSRSSAADGATTELPQLTKREVADRILDLVAAALDARDGAAQTGTTRQPASEPA